MAIECKSKGVAVSALETIAETLRGIQREALLAVKSWVQKNTNDGYVTQETLDKLNKIFNE